jgi:predicted nucleic acid-binding protein
MTVYALDTNIISYYLSKNLVIGNQIKAVVNNGSQVVIPEIAYYEIRRGLLSKFAPIKTVIFNDFCNLFDVGISNRETAEMAASVYSKLKKKGKVIEDADILIAAYCLQNNYILVTNNVKHFENIDGLLVENWAA